MGWCAQIKILLFLSCLTSFYLLFSFYFHFRSLISFTFTFQMLFSVVSYLLFYLVFCLIVFIIIFIISYTARYLEPKMSRKDQQLQCFLSRHTWKHVLLRLLEKQKRFLTSLLLFSNTFRNNGENSEQKNVLQTIEKLIQFNYLLL